MSPCQRHRDKYTSFKYELVDSSKYYINVLERFFFYLVVYKVCWIEDKDRVYTE